MKERILSGSLEDSDDSEGADGMGLMPESLQKTQSAQEKPLQSAPNKQAQGKPYNQYSKGSKPQGTGGYSRGNMKGPEDDEDESDPEWVDFDPKKDKAAFFGREIPDEKTLREQFEVQKERYGLNKRKNKNPDIEDKMDEMFFKKLEEDERLQAEAEKLQK